MAHIVENQPNELKPTIFEVLNKVKSAIGAVAKKERNTMQNFNFRGVDAVVNAAAPALNEHGVIVTPELLEYSYEVAEFGSKRTLMGHVLVKVRYTFWGPAGDCLSSTVFAESTDSGDKAAAKAMSVAYRIALLQTLNLPTDEPDPDSESYERSPASTPQPARRTSVPKGRLTLVYTGAENGVQGDSEIDWKRTIDGAKTREELNEVYKKAGSLGVLPTITDLLYKKADELGFKSGDTGS